MGLRSGPRLTLFCLAEQTAAGRKRKRGEARIEGSAAGRGGGLVDSLRQAGWPRRRRYRGSPFFFLPCRQNGGSCCCLGGLSTVRLYRIPPPHLSTLTKNKKNNHLTHSHVPVHPSPVPDQLGGTPCFVDAQESERTSSQKKRSLLLCQLPGKSAFYCH